jgi:parvulin-like peptidyl-prolyl isomerase
VTKTVPAIAIVVAIVSAGLLGGCRGGGQSGPGGRTDSGTGGTLVNSSGGTGSAADPSQAVVARIAGRTITEQQLRSPLVEAYGLNLLLNLVELELANREAERAGLTITEADVAAERQRTIDAMFATSNAQQLDAIDKARETDPARAEALLADLRKDNEAALDQYLAKERASRPQFDIVIRANTALRKIAEPQVEAALTDERLMESFRIQYGEKVRVRHIQTNSLTDMNTARRRLAAGEAFEKVASAMSTNNITGPLGGEVMPFTRNNDAFPQTFRDAAFALKPGEVSEVVSAGGAFHLIKLEERIDPKVVKFEDVKESLRQDLRERLLQAAAREARQQIKREALSGLSIEDPILRKQFNDQIEKEQAQLRDREAVREELTRQRQAIEAQQATDAQAATTTSATTRATSAPATSATTTTKTTTTGTTPTTGPAAAATTGPVRPVGSFVDGVLPATMPRPMPPAFPNEHTTHPTSAPATKPVPAR